MWGNASCQTQYWKYWVWGEDQHQEGKVPKSILHGLSLLWKISPPKASFSLYLYTSRFKASFMRGLTQTACIGENWYKEVALVSPLFPELLLPSCIHLITEFHHDIYHYGIGKHKLFFKNSHSLKIHIRNT